MPNLLMRLNKPEYFFRLVQLIHRLKTSYKPSTNTFEIVRLPWGVDLRIRPHEAIGRVVWRRGIYDLVVSEAIWRLLDSGERAVDIGANIGYMTSIMAVRSGSKGFVTAFEPHPVIFEELMDNIQRWRGVPDIARIDAYQLGIWNKNGRGCLVVPQHFEENRGTASLLLGNDVPTNAGSHYNILLIQLHDFFDDKIIIIPLLKIDVEGNEILVLEGATRLLDSRKVRDIIFEDLGKYPTPAMAFLERRGYSLFFLSRSFWGPSLVPVSQGINQGLPKYGDPPNYLATIDPDRARKRLKYKGWSILGFSLFSRGGSW